MKGLVRHRPVVVFFALAYLGSWLGWSPWWLSESGIGVLPFRLPFGVIAFVNQVGLFAGPFAAALLVTRVLNGPGSPRAFLARAFSFCGRPVLYVVALVVVPLIVAVPYLLLEAQDGVEGLTVSTLVTTLVTYLVYLAGGPLQEEPGWRGFALPRMQESMHPLVAAVGLGAVHTFWHAPLFLTDEWGHRAFRCGSVRRLFAAYCGAFNRAVLGVQHFRRQFNPGNTRPQLSQLGTAVGGKSAWFPDCEYVAGSACYDGARSCDLGIHAWAARLQHALSPMLTALRL